MWAGIRLFLEAVWFNLKIALAVAIPLILANLTSFLTGDEISGVLDVSVVLGVLIVGPPAFIFYVFWLVGNALDNY